MLIEQGVTYIFVKSGNRVRAIAPVEPCFGEPTWQVERTEGASAGKRMLVPASALVIPEMIEDHCAGEQLCR